MYCTVADLIDAVGEQVLIQLSDDSLPPVEINQVRCEQAISFGSELIDARLRGRYSSLPIPEPIPNLIREICVDIAIYRLYLRRGQDEIESIRNRYKDALENLKTIQLNQATPDIPNKSQEYLTNKTAADRIFNSSLLSGY